MQRDRHLHVRTPSPSWWVAAAAKAMREPFPMLVALCLMVVLASPVTAVELAMPFTDHMVLQRNAAAQVWGTGNPQEAITISLATQTQHAVVGSDGRWKVAFAPMPAGGPFVLSVAGATTVTVQDVLVGEVWLAGGQSNMDRTLGDENDAAKSSDHPTIRFLRTHPGKDHTAGEWAMFSPATGAGMSAVAFHFAKQLQQRLAVPIGVIIGAQGSTFIQRWWDPQVEAADAAMRKGGDLFQGYLHETAPYTVAGAIWYQGEADSKDGYAEVYHQRLPALIRYWRRVWQRPDLPFMVVQLPNVGPPQDQPEASDGGWPQVREGQRAALALPGTALVVTIDIGNGKVHPPDKHLFGQRLSLAARALVYGERDLAYSGPALAALKADGALLRVRFAHVGAGLITKDGGSPVGFALAGADGKWVWADARIDGDAVTLSNAQVPKPLRVRYAWAQSPRFNLFNAEGLPASPFEAAVP